MSAQTVQTTMRNLTDEAVICTLYHQMMAGWNQGNADAFAAPFTEDADFIAFDGAHFKGNQEIVQTHQSLFETHLKGTRLIGHVTSVRFLTADVALMHAVGGTVTRGKSAPSSERDSIQTLVATKRGSDWRLAAFHNTSVTAHRP